MALHTIGFACRHSGLSADAIRVWERRYGAVRPTRADGGRRLYSDGDVERLGLLAAAVRGGHAIGLVAGLPDEELRRMVGAVPRAGGAATGTAASCPGFVEECFAAAIDFDDRRLRATLERASFACARLELVEGVLAPLLERIGNAWRAGELTPAHEHLVSAVLRDFLVVGRGLGPAPAAAPRLVVTTLAGERHELAAWLVSATAAVAGWEGTWLGPDLPAADIARVAQALHARGVAISVTVAGARAERELAALRAALPDLPLLVGGRAAGAVAASAGNGVIAIERLGDLPAALASIAAAPAARPRAAPQSASRRPPRR
jgi:methanogenic corrinoid protein MtbC1